MYMKRSAIALGLLCATLFHSGFILAAPKQVPADRLLSNDELVSLLESSSDSALEEVRRRFDTEEIAGLQALAGYFREAFSERYYFDWKNTDERFADYRTRFTGKYGGYAQKKDIHLSMFPAFARWKLPYDSLKGEPVSAYEYRHLARQHKVLDMAFVHLYEDRRPEYVDYFTAQRDSLNAAFEAGEYEKDEDGNGVYESFRAGYRVMNWLQVHAFFLGTDRYDWRDQLETIRTLLHTGAMLHERNRSFRYGNHQTRGAVALAMIAILLRDFAGTDAWYRDAMDILGEHLEKEVNPDGFQFERSVHYHIGDIFNFFQVLQLAQLNGMPVPEEWRRKLKSMFDAAVVLARPNRTLPVLQDDTDAPWSEFNVMGDFMLMGAILFDDPVINYFAADAVAPAVYWLLRDEQIDALASLDRDQPKLMSAELSDTGYYVMREGWDHGDYYMVISAGLSEHKPDHQHGDMLGLVARANGQEILPNYQVRYSLPDYEYFKNSLVKNVAIVDGIPHGSEWKGNTGGSGFGKWLRLPQPTVIAWLKTDDWDFFAGTHNGYNDLGVEYYRKVLFLKGLGWIIRDVFESNTGSHEYQQVWQGHYSDEGGGNHHRATFADGSGLEILQLGGQAQSRSLAARRGKGSLVYTIVGERGDYTTLLYPFKNFSSRIPNSLLTEGRVQLNGWTLRKNTGRTETGGLRTDAALIVEHENGAILLDTRWISTADATVHFDVAGDLYLEYAAGGAPLLTLLGHESVSYRQVGRDATAREGRIEPAGRLEL